MQISFGTRLDVAKGINNANGYGYATNCMLDSLQRLDYQVEANNSSADVEIWFDQPHHWKFSKGPYKIGYHPWESTKLLPGWAEIMNQCDEIWTPSPLIADWYVRYAGVRVPVHVYEHGIEDAWQPLKREPDDTIRFLHVGAEAARKGGWDVVRAFRAAFQGRKDVELTLKMVNVDWMNLNSVGRVRYIKEKYSFAQLQDLFYRNHVYVYPSAGEGFGFTPLQAMATGMPTITVPSWAPYERFLDERLNIGSKLVTSSWPKIHPGKVFRPNFDDMVDNMRFAADNYESVRDYALSQTSGIFDYYDWDKITAKVFGDLEHRIKA